MTTQITDMMLYENETYFLFWSDGDSLPGPNDFEISINRDQLCSACWSGFHSIYEVFDSRLLLKDMTIYTKDHSTKINNTAPTVSPSGGSVTYEKVNLVVTHTGKLTIAKDMCFGLNVPNDLIDPIIFNDVYDLTFLKGRLVSSVNISKQMERQRNDGTLDRFLDDIPF